MIEISMDHLRASQWKKPSVSIQLNIVDFVLVEDTTILRSSVHVCVPS